MEMQKRMTGSIYLYLRRSIALLLTVILLCPTCPVEVPADEEPGTLQGSYGDNITWSLDYYGTLRLEGTGDMAAWEGDTEDVPWAEEDWRITTLDIGAGITAISQEALESCAYTVRQIIFRGETVPAVLDDGGMLFSDFESLWVIYAPEASLSVYRSELAQYMPSGRSVTFLSIGDATEYLIEDGTLVWYSDRIADVVIPDGVTVIGEFVFSLNMRISSVTFPEGLRKIESGAFDRTMNLHSVSFPDALEEIEGYAFYGSGLSNTLHIPASVSALSCTAFYQCDIERLELTGNSLQLTGLQQNMFDNMPALTEIAVPGAVLEDYRAFLADVNNDGERVSLVALDGTEFEIENGVLTAYQGAGGDVVIPDGVTEIGGSAFYGSPITNVSFPDGLLRIGQYAFAGSSLAGEVVIPDSVTDVGIAAFANCTGLTSLVLGAGVRNVDVGYANQNQQSLLDGSGVTELTFKGETVPAFHSYYFFRGTCVETVYVPKASYTDYIGSIPTDSFYGVFRAFDDDSDCVVNDDHVLLYYQGSSDSVTVPDDVVEIYQGAFSEKDIRQVALPEGLSIIGDGAFLGCPLESVNFPSSLTSVGQGAFYGCAGLTGTVTLGRNIHHLGSTCFQGCSGIERLVFKSSQVPYVFYETSHGGRENVFEGMTALTEVVVPAGFYEDYRTVLEEFLPDGAVITPAVEEDEFVVEAGVLTAYNGFGGQVAIPEGVTGIGDGVFEGNAAITGVTFPEALQSIGGHAFRNCSGIRYLAFTGSEPPEVSPEYNPFTGLTGLETVYVPQDSHDAYVDVLQDLVGSSVAFSSDYFGLKVAGLRAAFISGGSVKLVWQPHGSSLVTGYTVKRDGEAVATVTEPVFTERGLTAGQTYCYTVCGTNAEGETTPEASVSVTPCAPAILSVTGEGPEGQVLPGFQTLTASVQGDMLQDWVGGDETVVTFYYQLNGEEIKIGDGIPDTRSTSGEETRYTTVWDISGLAGGAYTVCCRLVDIDGEISELGQTITVDLTRPEKIASLVALGDVARISLSWSIAQEAGTQGYRIYRRTPGEEDFTLLAEVSGRSTQSYADEAVEYGQIYEYRVSAVDDRGVEGEPSDIAEGSLIPDTEPPVVTGLSPAGGFLAGAAAFSMTAEDDLAVVSAELAWSADNVNWTVFAEGALGNLTGTLDTTQIDLSALNADRDLWIRAIARDAAGNESTPFTVRCRVDNEGPDQVTGLTGRATSVTVTLQWNDVAADDIASFLVEARRADGSYEEAARVSRTLGANLYGLVPDTDYTYRVTGIDVRGNKGLPSEEVTVRTASDETGPVIVRLRPMAGYYTDSIPLEATARDEYAVSGITLQMMTISADSADEDVPAWEDVAAETYTGAEKTRTMRWVLDISQIPEGRIYVRALAVDPAGNVSDASADAPMMEYYADRTAPAVPQGAAAVGEAGYIEVSWLQGTEADLGAYSVYRSSSENGEYTPIKSGLMTLNYIDRDVAPDTDYFYKVSVRDRAGNESDLTPPVTARMMPDLAAPEIVSLAPAEGTALSEQFCTVSALATDNYRLAEVALAYSRDGLSFTELAARTEIGTNHETLTAQVPVDLFLDGETVTIRATATDTAGNEATPVIATYSVDRSAPSVTDVNVFYADGVISVSWTGGSEADLNGYRIYRRLGEGSYALIGQRQAGSSCTYADDGLAPEAQTYRYKVEAIDRCGNTSSAESESVTTPDRSMPVPVLSCDNVMETGVEYYIDARDSCDNSAVVSWEIDFGDGSEPSREARVIHVYEQTGTYEISLTVTDDDGNSASVTRTVEVRERGLIGTARIHVVDADGIAIPGASVYFDLGEDCQVVKYTDRSGDAFFTANAGVHTVGCIIPDNEWLPAKKDIILTAGGETAVTMTLVRHVMVEGVFETTRMTFEEIVAAGIDVTRPENQYFVQVNVQLTYGNEEVETEFIYNEVTGQTYSEPQIVDTPTGQRQIVATVLQPAHLPSVEAYSFSEEPTVAFLDIPVGISSLKEFFDVNLHIINNASDSFSMLGNRIRLHLPDGLALMETAVSETSADVYREEIKGQTTETVRWILRGDEIGEYYLSADYSGLLSEFDETVSAVFEATEPIRVYGLTNMKLRLDIPDALDHGTFYYNASLINQGHTDIFLPMLDTGDTLIETELFDATGANVADLYDLDYSQVRELALSTSIEGNLKVLASGCRLTRHYMNVADTTYTENELLLSGRERLEEYAAELSNTYGIEVEFITRPVSYFKEGLSKDINPAGKADLTFRENLSAYEQVMDDYSYLYWLLYEQKIDTEGFAFESQGSLPGNLSENLWAVASVIGGVDGGIESLFGLDDAGRIDQIILDAMEAAVEENGFSYQKVFASWADKAADWLEREEIRNWVTDRILEILEREFSDLPEEVLARSADLLGQQLPEVFRVAVHRYSAPGYTVLKAKADDKAIENGLAQIWQLYAEEAADTVQIVTVSETVRSQILHEIFTAQAFKAVWETVNTTSDTANLIIRAANRSNVDQSIFLAAQAQIEDCNLFLDALIAYTSAHFPDGEARQVAVEAARIKNIINEQDPMAITAGFIGNIGEEVAQVYLKKGLNSLLGAVEEAGGTPVQVAKRALNLSVSAGDNVFHVKDRFDIADNIRYLYWMSEAMKAGVRTRREVYEADRLSEDAADYLALLGFLINVRSLGESEMARFGMSYEVAQGFFDSRELLTAAKAYSGCPEAASWVEWRDNAQDRLSMLRVQLFRNPITVDAAAMYEAPPVVTFNYAEGRTLQAFDDTYEYSLDGGKTWTSCDGSPIEVAQSSITVELLVRKKEAGTSLTTRVTIRYIGALPGQPAVIRRDDGIRVTGLDNTRRYELLIAKDALHLRHDDSLAEQAGNAVIYRVLPEGSYSFDFKTNESYAFVYIRSLADVGHYASGIRELAILPHDHVWVVKETVAAGYGVDGYELSECSVCGGQKRVVLPRKTYSLKKASVAKISAYTYSGKAIKPSPVIKYGKTTLRKGTDYTLSYKNNTNVGLATVTVKGRGKYAGTLTATFAINPKGTTISSLTAASKAFTVKWKKQASRMASSRVTGYQIQYATNKTFTKNKKAVKIKGYSKTARKVTGLKAKTRYYVRVRTYMTVGGKTYYSPWSKAKVIRTA